MPYIRIPELSRKQSIWEAERSEKVPTDAVEQGVSALAEFHIFDCIQLKPLIKLATITIKMGQESGSSIQDSAYDDLSSEEESKLRRNN